LPAVARELRENGFARMDVDDAGELEEVLRDLEEHGVAAKGAATAYTADGMEDEPEFYARVRFAGGGYVDFFLVDQQEETYDEIFWG
jgi:hypothetical protein